MRPARSLTRDARRIGLAKSRSSSRPTGGKEFENKYQVEEFWTRVSNAVPDRTFLMWEALEGALEKYNSTLHERQALMTETEALRSQNDQLKALLNQYLGSKVNEDLYVPPTQLLSMQALHSESGTATRS